MHKAHCVYVTHIKMRVYYYACNDYWSSQVSTYGVLSFRQSFFDFSPEPFPLSFQNDILIAPFWDDSDNSAGGQVLYRFTDDQSILEEIATNISDTFEVNFNPATAVIVTWDSLPQFSGPVSTVSSFRVYLFLLGRLRRIKSFSG